MKHGQAFRHWKKIIQGFECSGKSLADFCRDEQLSTNSAYKWHKRFKDLDMLPIQSDSNPMPGFIEIPSEFSVQKYVTKEVSNQSLELSFSGDISLKIPDGFNPETFKQVVDILREDG